MAGINISQGNIIIKISYSSAYNVSAQQHSVKSLLNLFPSSQLSFQICVARMCLS